MSSNTVNENSQVKSNLVDIRFTNIKNLPYILPNETNPIFIIEIDIPDDAQIYTFNVIHKYADFDVTVSIFNSNNIIYKKSCRLEDFYKWSNEDFCHKSVNINGILLKYIEKQTLELCTIATNNNTHSLQFVNIEFQTYELCSNVIKNNYAALSYVNKLIEHRLYYSLCIYAINISGFALKFVPKHIRDRNLIVMAIKKNSYSYDRLFYNETGKMDMDVRDPYTRELIHSGFIHNMDPKIVILQVQIDFNNWDFSGC